MTSDLSGVARYNEDAVCRVALSLVPWETALRSRSETELAAWLRDDLWDALFDAAGLDDACRRDLRICDSVEGLMVCR